ncbi:MAG: hypothetical protein ACI9BD_001401 [Candidatus Marinamargulisbacteria bacterium]|jgi:hypothetical protein
MGLFSLCLKDHGLKYIMFNRRRSGVKTYTSSFFSMRENVLTLGGLNA